MNSFTIEADGLRYRGAWLLQGETLEVRSDYGSTSVALGERDPAAAARQVLRELARIDDRSRRSPY
jgi:hypothetical protein